MRPPTDHYGAAYGDFGSDLQARIRAEAYGEDYGQNGWQSADEQDLFIAHLRLDAESRLLDVACGSGGPRTDNLEDHDEIRMLWIYR